MVYRNLHIAKSFKLRFFSSDSFFFEHVLTYNFFLPFRTCLVTFFESVNFSRNLYQKKRLPKSLISAPLRKWRKILTPLQCPSILQNQGFFARVKLGVGRVTLVKNWTRHLMRSLWINWTGQDCILIKKKNNTDLSVTISYRYIKI